MIRHLLAAALALAALPLLAQGPQDATPAAERKIEPPKHKCADPGPFPGRAGMQSEESRNRFIKGVESYRNCMMAFIEERKAVLAANQEAANAAVHEFNARMKRLNEEQEKARE